ncbi:MAG: hypothetical protein GX196_07310 [Clostridiaceae bacterium]|nr:hypothetical protein [Clostridiaceae bacterium]
MSFFEKARESLILEIKSTSKSSLDFDVFVPKNLKFGDLSSNVFLKNEGISLCDFTLPAYFSSYYIESGFLNVFVDRSFSNEIIDEILREEGQIKFDVPRFYDFEPYGAENEKFYHFHLLSRINKLTGIHYAKKTELSCVDDSKWELIWSIARQSCANDKENIKKLCRGIEKFYKGLNSFDGESLTILKACGVVLEKALCSYYG